LFEEAPKESVGKGIGHFFGAMEIDGFEEVDVFKKRIDHWIEVFRQTKPAPGHEAVLIPGDPEHEAEKIRTKYGVPVIEAVVNDLREISKMTKVGFEVSGNT
jgi:LDH2 family malate/lactate/ureidoglycolate dehydrogenase